MKLLCDHMLGTLAKWLRFLGFDTAYVGSMSDEELKRIATLEDRVILTRDKDLSRTKGVRAVLIGSDDLDLQLISAIRSLGLEIEEPLSRCSTCNALVEEVGREEAEGNVPKNVLSDRDVVFRCTDCGKYYWQGSHWQEILDRIERIRGQVS